MRNVVIESTQGIQVSAIKWISENLFLGTDKRFPSRRLILTFTGNRNGIVLILWLCECTSRYQALLIAQPQMLVWHRVATAPLKETNYAIKRNTKRRFSTRNFHSDTFFSCSNGNYTNHTFSFLPSKKMDLKCNSFRWGSFFSRGDEMWFSSLIKGNGQLWRHVKGLRATTKAVWVHVIYLRFWRILRRIQAWPYLPMPQWTSGAFSRRLIQSAEQLSSCFVVS